ncbi:MAG TPA: bifunctional [glutamine synthetase] adenylyltransferase/[glutamine synthetase]-adenylyl-L-tyrosine phosphorylase [Rhizomicrobium sp.]|nr:bifunctional [glutamine synthetase] adenylyltransferase/[glutamine synthetase]-adenylyl-L-tyrosine phosphorylase [Rhizomicrobium sp.]
MTDLPVPAKIPLPFEPARAERTLEALADGEDGFTPAAEMLPLLRAAFGNSPFLARLAVREREFLSQLLGRAPEATLAAIEDDCRSAVHAADIAGAMAILRRAKRRAALAIAFADIAGAWNLKQVTRALSGFADVCVSSALRFLLINAARQADMDASDPAKLEAETGLVILAMGKYGAFELNYSSDIDLVVFYDPRRFPFRKKGDPRAAAVDIVKGLVRLLSEVTGDGYVFRVDLRLRPDAGATQVAISTDAAEAYYEGMGQNWERAAMIKARACAGDMEASAAFLKSLSPFVWRRSLDYAAIEDIHSIKRQIHSHGKHGDVAVAGHNIKLGRGGIREIEFFAQTQQLILGGRNPLLRSPVTLEAIEALRQAGLVSGTTTSDLSAAYVFLRTLEHRLQMIEDQQTHVMPKSAEEIAHIACFMGFADSAALSAVLLHHLNTVQGHYLRLFERAAPLAANEGSLVFTGVEDDPETIQTLANMGFQNPGHVAQAIRGWHHGRIRATRSARAREILTKLMPALLDALAATADPDAAFAQFDRFISRLPAGVQLFSLFLANTHLLRVVADICGSAPNLADHLARSPGVLDALLDPGFLGSLPSRGQLDEMLGVQLQAASDYEAALDAARRFAKEQIFRCGVQILEGTLDARIAGPAFAAIAETAVAGLLKASEADLALTAGRIGEGAFCVVAMGKLGGREMTAASDLDLIFVYDAPEAAVSDGHKQLSATTYYARLAQRLIAALTVPTAQGTLYEVDMRLRPTGNKGPVAVSLESFERYHATESWTWERLALTRARVIAGSAALGVKVAGAITQVVAAKPDPGKILRDAADMREKLAAQFPGRKFWDLKFTRGGLVDIEFVAQTLQLVEAGRVTANSNTISALGALEEIGALSPQEASTLVAAYGLQLALTQVLRIAVDGVLDVDAATSGLKALLARVGGETDFAHLEAKLQDLQARAFAIFRRRIAEEPV